MANPWDAGIPVGDNTDPELLQAIEALSKQSWASKPIKPSKFNLGETRSPLEILKAEAAGENTTTTNWGNWEAKGMSLKPAKYSADKPWDKGIPVTEQPKKQAMPWDAGIPVADSIIDTIGEESNKFSNWLTKGIEEAKADRPAAVAGFLAGNAQFPMQVVESAAELATWPVHRRSWSEMQANIAKTMQEQKEALLPKKAVEMIDSPAGQAGAAVPFAPFTYPLERIPEALTEHGYPETAAAVGVLTPPVLGAVGARQLMKGGKVKEAPEPAPKERDFVPAEEVPSAKEEPNLPESLGNIDPNSPAQKYPEFVKDNKFVTDNGWTYFFKGAEVKQDSWPGAPAKVIEVIEKQHQPTLYRLEIDTTNIADAVDANGVHENTKYALATDKDLNRLNPSEIESTPEIPPRILESVFPEVRPDMITKDLPKDPEVVRVTDRVNYIAKLIEEDATIGRVQFEIRQLQKALERRNIHNENKRLNPRVRGTDYIEQKLLEAKRGDALSQEGISLARWMLNKNPNLGVDLAYSLVGKMEAGSSGRYNPLARLMKLKEGGESPLTIAHELLHHSERMLPPKIQDAIRGEWLKQLVALENHARKTNDRLAKAAIADVFRASAGDEQAARRVREAIIIGDLDKDFYQYTSPSEFWAENGSRIIRDKAHASKSWVREVKQWLKEFIERIKSYAGISSDHAVIQALNDVLNPKKITGEFKSKEMLSESKREVGSAPRDTAQSKARNQERIIQLLRSESTFGRFLRKAKTLDLNVTDAQWKAIFDDKDRQLAKYDAEPSTFSKRSGAEKVLGTDTRDWKQFSEEVLAKAKLVKNIDDIKDLGTYLLAPRNLQFLKNRLADGPIGAKVMSWAIDKNYTITRMWDRIASEVIHGPTREGAGITTMREFKKGREGVLKPVTDLKRRDQAGVFRAWLDMEKDNSALVAKGLQWADDAMLRDKYHLTEPQIQAYKSMTKLMDTLMDITNESLVKQGKEPIQKIPGFFPRYLKGRYRIHLHIKPSDVMKAAGVKGGLVDILQFKSRAAADSWLKDNFGKDPRMPDRNGFFIGRGRDGDFVQGNSLDVDIANFASDMSIAAQVMMSKGKLNPILRRRLNNLVSRASSAELRQTHERSGALTTYRGSEGIRDSLYGELADTTEILNVFNQYTQSVFKYAKNVDLHTEVLLPIREAIGGKLPNTLRYVDEMIGNAMDNNPNKFEIFDKFLDNIQGKWVEPGTVQKAVPWINKALIAKALAGSGSFLAVQALQPYVAATMFLPMFHAEMGRFGNKVPFGASTRAMTRAFKELYVGLSPEGREAMSYAVKNHITDTAIWETLQKDLKLKGLVGDSLDKAFHKLQIRPILENIESASRGHTFMQGYFYARNAGFTKDAALGFADKYTSVMMGDYSKVFRPLMMENLGVVGHLQTPFATLMNTYIGNMAQGTSNLAKSLATMPGVNKLPYMTVVKKLPGIRDIDLTEPNRPQFKQAAVAAAAFTGAVWAWSGFQGMPGVQEWQAAADKWNEHFPENPMVGPQEMMFEHNVSDFNKYGLASTLVGANIGQSMNAPSLAGRMGVPSAPLISDFGEIIWGALRTIFSEGKTEGEWFRLGSRIAPPPLRPVVEQKYTTETGMVPVPGTSLQGFRERTTGDTVARYLGTRSIEEANELARFWITQARDSRENKAKAMLSRQIMSAWMTDAPPEKIEAILDKSESVGADPQDVLDNAKDLYLGRYIGWKERKQLKAGEGISGAHKLQSLENLYQE